MQFLKFNGNFVSNNRQRFIQKQRGGIKWGRGGGRGRGTTAPVGELLLYELGTPSKGHTPGNTVTNKHFTAFTRGCKRQAAVPRYRAASALPKAGGNAGPRPTGTHQGPPRPPAGWSLPARLGSEGRHSLHSFPPWYRRLQVPAGPGRCRPPLLPTPPAGGCRRRPRPPRPGPAEAEPRRTRSRRRRCRNSRRPRRGPWRSFTPTTTR